PHNRIHFLKGAGFAAASPVLWFASYWVFKGLLVVFCFLWGIEISPGWTAAIAWGCMGILAVEGLWYGKSIRNIVEASDSAYLAGPYLPGTGIHPPGAYAYLLAHAVFAAPRSTVKAVGAFRRLVFFDSKRDREAGIVLAELAARNAWVPVAEFAPHRAAIVGLETLGLVWARFEDDSCSVRIAADLVREFAVRNPAPPPAGENLYSPAR
ncbi:MAG: hypothetical protein AAB215_04075, partial [Planctomycetota bacterium]